MVLRTTDKRSPQSFGCGVYFFIVRYYGDRKQSRNYSPKGLDFVKQDQNKITKSCLCPPKALLSRIIGADGYSHSQKKVCY